MQGGDKAGPILIMHTAKGVTPPKNQRLFYYKIPCDNQCISPSKKKKKTSLGSLKNEKPKRASPFNFPKCLAGSYAWQAFLQNKLQILSEVLIVIESRGRIMSMKPL